MSASTLFLSTIRHLALRERDAPAQTRRFFAVPALLRPLRLNAQPSQQPTAPDLAGRGINGLHDDGRANPAGLQQGAGGHQLRQRVGHALERAAIIGCGSALCSGLSKSIASPLEQCVAERGLALKSYRSALAPRLGWAAR